LSGVARKVVVIRGIFTNIFFWRRKMSSRNKEEIAGIVRNTLITKYGYQVEGDYVRKPISDNYGIGFYHKGEDTLCICVYHCEGLQFSPKQKSIILEVLSRKEFQESYNEAVDGDSSDGKAEIWSSLNINVFDGWEDQDIADWIVKLFEHFITTVTLLELT
jgi:hypothetical protein